MKVKNSIAFVLVNDSPLDSPSSNINSMHPVTAGNLVHDANLDYLIEETAPGSPADIFISENGANADLLNGDPTVFNEAIIFDEIEWQNPDLHTNDMLDGDIQSI